MASLKITIRSSATEERTVEVPIPSSRPLGGGNTEVREFLALRAQQRKAAIRARRIKRTCLALGAATAVAVFVVPKFRTRWRTAVATTQMAPLVPETAPGVATPALDPASPPAASFDEPVSLAAVAPVALAAEPPPADPGSCADDFEQRRWRAAVENCSLTFEAAPEAGLALKVAHAHWARGDVRLSGEWAEKAVALGTTDADAYVLIGHAERRAGHAEQAITAYRQYLRASPRGWHVRTVRAALRRLRPAQEQQAATATAEPTAQNILR